MLTAQDIIDAPATYAAHHRRRLLPRNVSRYAHASWPHALPDEYGGDRSASTAIYYLLTPETFSAIHRVKSDEVFHFYAGDAVEMLQLWPDGAARRVIIHNDLAAGHEPQLVVPAGVWQGCRLIPGGNWALLGCTVAPGFDYADFELGNRIELLAQYPEHSVLVTALTGT